MSSQFGFLADSTFADKMDALNNKLGQTNGLLQALVADRTGYKPESWAAVQALVRSGMHSEIFAIGDQFACMKGETPLVWDVIGIDHDTPTDTQFTHSMTLQLHDSIAEMQFDAREALFCFANGLAAGTYHFTVKAHTWVSGDVNKTFQFTLTQAIPANGQIVVQNASNVTFAGSSLKTYASAASGTEIETATITEGSDGTSLGDVDNTISDGTNCLERALTGNGNYAQSALRQYINSAAAAGSVWAAKNAWDRAPSWNTNREGFLNGVDEDFLSVIGAVTKTTALNTVCENGGGAETTERFFLLSRSEVYGNDETTGGEGTAYAYYSRYSGLPAAGTGADYNRIKYRDGTAKYWWMRTPYNMQAGSVRIIGTTGAISNNTSVNALGVAPACCII